MTVATYSPTRALTIGTAHTGQVGWPDIVAVHEGRGLLLVVELKSHRGRMTVDQERWLDAFAAAGADVWRFRPADYDALLEHILGPRLLQRHRRTVEAALHG